MCDSSEDEFTCNRTKRNKKTIKINEDDISMDEVENALSEIDLKYFNYSNQSNLDKNLTMLLQVSVDNFFL